MADSIADGVLSWLVTRPVYVIRESESHEHLKSFDPNSNDIDEVDTYPQPDNVEELYQGNHDLAHQWFCALLSRYSSPI